MLCARSLPAKCFARVLFARFMEGSWWRTARDEPASPCSKPLRGARSLDKMSVDFSIALPCTRSAAIAGGSSSRGPARNSGFSRWRVGLAHKLLAAPLRK